MHLFRRALTFLILLGLAPVTSAVADPIKLPAPS